MSPFALTICTGGVAVAVMMTLAPFAIVARKESANADGPTVHVFDAFPFASVWLIDALTDPPPDRTVQLTGGARDRGPIPIRDVDYNRLSERLAEHAGLSVA